MARSQNITLNHPFWIFWLGILTGALTVGLIFSYIALQEKNLENAILKSGKITTTTTINSLESPEGNY